MPPNSNLQTQAIPTMQSPLIKPLEEMNPKSMKKNTKGMGKLLTVMIVLFVISAGSGTGYLLSGRSGTGNSQEKVSETGMGSVTTGNGAVKEEGIKDEKLFPNKAEGEVQVNDGSVTKEGTHILIRPGGADQTAYLTSSVVDLDKFVGKKVEVYGITNTAQKAGWLLDVGYARVIE